MLGHLSAHTHVPGQSKRIYSSSYSPSCSSSHSKFCIKYLGTTHVNILPNTLPVTSVLRSPHPEKGSTKENSLYTMEPPNIGDKHFVYCSEVVPSPKSGQPPYNGQTVCPLPIYCPYISTSKEGTTSEQWTKHSSPTCPLFRGHTILAGVVFGCPTNAPLTLYMVVGQVGESSYPRHSCSGVIGLYVVQNDIHTCV